MNLSLRHCLAGILSGGVLSVPLFAADHVDSKDDGCGKLSFKVGETIYNLDDLKARFNGKKS